LDANYPGVIKERPETIYRATCSIRIHKRGMEKTKLFVHCIVLTVVWKHSQNTAVVIQTGVD